MLFFQLVSGCSAHERGEDSLREDYTEVSVGSLLKPCWASCKENIANSFALQSLSSRSLLQRKFSLDLHSTDLDPCVTY